MNRHQPSEPLELDRRCGREPRSSWAGGLLSRWYLAALLVTMLVAGCNGGPAPTLVLISLDGFRWDYLERPQADRLVQWASTGVRAEGLIPSFPSKTFPNHYTVVTGLVPDHHGLVANNMWDPGTGKSFDLYNRAEVGDSSWYGGTPIWVLAEEAGLPTAPLFWPGSAAAISGRRPSYWKPFDYDMAPDSLVAEALALLGLPSGERPRFLTLYFHQTDGAGHDYGPGSPELDESIGLVVAAVDSLMTGLKNLGLAKVTDVVVVSDHGMETTDTSKVVILDDYLDFSSMRISDWNPVLAIWPDSAEVTSTLMKLRQVPHLTVYRREQLPVRFHYGTHPRVAPIIGLVEPGWTLTSRDYASKNSHRFGGGNHGYDPATQEMHGIFLAWGPSFRRGITLPRIDNVHLYPLMAAVMGLEPAPNDGSLAVVAGALVPEVLRSAQKHETAATP